MVTVGKYKSKYLTPTEEWDLFKFGRESYTGKLDSIVKRLKEEEENRIAKLSHQGKKGAKAKLRLTNYEWKSSYKYAMFNPEQFGDTKSVSYGTINAPMQSYPRHIYQGGEVATIDDIELYCNNSNPAYVREMVIWLQNFLPNELDGITVKVPPTLLFSWGGWYTKRCILKSLRTEYTLFNEDLQPIECRMTLGLEIVPIGTDPWTPQVWEVIN